MSPKRASVSSKTSPPSAYLSLARKYRPQTFEELVGQPHASTTLRRALETKRLGQAFLFAGQRGVGKTSAARILAKALNCERGPTPTPCRSCDSCRAIEAGNSLDVIEIDGASNRGIDDIRQLREQVKFAPVHGQFRVYIIDEVHQITPDAFNALLKTLEEPPAHVKFIFATTAPQKVPQTILSRCQRFDFRRLDSHTVVSALAQIGKRERFDVEEAALYAIARCSEGSLRDAEVILEQLVSFCPEAIREADVSRLLGTLEQDALMSWAQHIFDRDANAALLFLARQVEQGKDVTQLLIGLLTHLRNLLILRTAANSPARPELVRQLVDVPEEQRAKLEEQAQRAAPEELLLMLQVLTGAYEVARRSPFAQAILEFALIKLATRESWQSLEQIIQRLDQLSQGASESPRPAQSPRPAPAPARAVSSMTAQPAAGAPVREEHRESVPAQPSDGPVALEQVAAQWPAILERIGRQKMSLAAYLMYAQPVGVTGNILQVGLPGFSLHQEVVAAPDNARFIEQTLRECLSTALTVEYTTLPEPAPAPADAPASGPAGSRAPASSSAPVPPIVQDIVQLFNATIVNPSSPS